MMPFLMGLTAIVMYVTYYSLTDLPGVKNIVIEFLEED